MSTLRRLCALFLTLLACAHAHAQEPPPDPGPTNLLQFEFSVVPTNNAVLITATTNVLSVTISNWMAFTNIMVIGAEGTNTFDLNDTGAAPDSTPNDGVFRGNLVTPTVVENTPFEIFLTLIGADLASFTNEPPVDPPVMITNRIQITYIVVPRPRNDAFTNAFKLVSDGGLAIGTNTYASMEPREPGHGGVNTVGQSVWWTWSPPVDGGVIMDLAGTDFPAVLAVYRGDRISNLVAVATSTSQGGPLPPHVTFTAVRAATYRVAVAGVTTNDAGNIRLRVAPGGTPDTRPPVVSIQSPAPDSIVTGETVFVSGSAREAFPLDSGVSNVVLQINGGPRTNAIGAETWSAEVTLPPGTNVITAFAIDYAGNVSAQDSIVVRYLNPTNDYFALSSQLEGTGGFVSAANLQATREPGEPIHAGNEGGRSVWYWWRAPADGQLALTTSGSFLDTLLAVYRGDTLTNLTEVVSNDDGAPGISTSDVSLFVSSNEVYRVVVDSYGAAVGEFGLQYIFTPLQPGSFFNLAINQAIGGVISPPGGAFPAGSRVVLTAVPQPDFAFVGWEGDMSSAENPLTVVMSQNLRLAARFRTVRFTEDFETADFTRIPWILNAPPWTVQTNVTAGGRHAARSAQIGARESTSLTITTNTGMGSASFDVRVSSETAWDFFEFLIDGTVVRRWSGEVPWTTFTFNLSAGTHTFVWRYTKDPNFEVGLDAGFIDNLYLPPPRDIGGGSQQPTLVIHLFSEGAQLTLEGEPSVAYTLEAAPQLGGPWTTIATQASPSGIINILDLQSVGQSRRFYRARVQ